MTVRVAWDNEAQTILRYDFEERWSLTDFYLEKAKGDAMIDAAPHKLNVGVLFVMPRTVQMPANAITATRQGMNSKHPRAVLIVLTTESRFTITLYDVLARIYPPITQVYKRADTLEAARTLIASRLALPA